MPSKRYNIWLETSLIKRIKKAAKSAGVKISTFLRMAALEKLARSE